MAWTSVIQERDKRFIARQDTSKKISPPNDLDDSCLIPLTEYWRGLPGVVCPRHTQISKEEVLQEV